MSMLLAALMLAPGASALCMTPTAASTAGVTVVEQPGTEPGYRVLRAAGTAGAYLLIYFDLASETAARSYAPCLAAELQLLRTELGDDRADAEWWPAVFTSDPAYVPPRGPGAKPRWRVATDGRGKITELGRSAVVRLIPHEQVHAWQNRAGARVPRWFSEGHATWVGLKVTAAIDPAAVAKERERMALELTLSKTPLALKTWGSVRPKREAIMRQVSPEDRARMIADPTYSPQGSYTFTSADFIGDESNMQARYTGAWQVFAGLEQRHGAAKVRAFATEATATPGMRTVPMLTELAQKHFGESLDTLLAEPTR